MLYERPKVNAPSTTKGKQLREWATVQLKKLEGRD
jgi:hypothetical protein